MADAFSLAVNIFTLLEFGRKFATLAWAIHKDGKDAVSKIASLDLTSKDLSQAAGGLSQPVSSPGAHNQDQTTERIHQLATRCIKVAEQMQETINGLGMHPRSRKKGSAVVKAFKYKWKESDVVAFQSEIEDLRSELMLNLILWLRTGMMKSLENQDRMIQDLSDFRSHNYDLKDRLDDLGHQHEGLGQQIVEILSFNATSATQSNLPNQSQTSLEMDLMNALQISSQAIDGEEAARLKLSPYRLYLVQRQFMGLLRYDSMFDRESGVAEAHSDTLKWIFDDPSGDTNTWSNFSQWLESEDQLYWITGKMGSGKSTLMKYISGKLPATLEPGTKRRCTPHLLRWAQDRPLFVGTFYFWAGSNDRTKIQTSVEGLYRTLLAQILEAYPESAPRISPQLWESLCLFNKDLSIRTTDLKVMSRKAIEYVSSVAKVCLFIDGLDEFGGEGDDLKDLVTWVKTLVEISPVKLCVASRPWRIFEDALQGRPHLLMENFNFKDIQRYVWWRCNDDPNFRARQQVEAAFLNQLLFEIINKAEGVFLWVHIVCTHLLEAMSRGDLVGDLRRILVALPVQMEKLYDHILDNLELKDHAAEYFLLLQACLERPDAIVFSLADAIGDDSEFSLRMPKAPLSDAVLQHRVTELGKRLNSRCRGILSLAVEEAIDSRQTRVHSVIQYCHRSAKDYLTMGTIQEKLIRMLNAPFDPHIRLCSAYLARWKCYPSDATDSERRACIYTCMEHAKQVVSESNDMMVRILDSLDTDFEPSSYVDHEHFGPMPWFGGNILSLTVVLGIKEYVKCKIGRSQGCCVAVSSSSICLSRNETSGPTRSTKPEQNREINRMKAFLALSDGEKVEWPLLLDALIPATQPNPEMVSFLLEHGADPNLIIQCAGGKTDALTAVVVRLREANLQSAPKEGRLHKGPLDEEGKARAAWVDSLCLLLQHGAKPDVSDMGFLRQFIGKREIHARRVPHLGRHREFILKLFCRLNQKRWRNPEIEGI